MIILADDEEAVVIEDKKLTGYPSIDKPWLKFYSNEAINDPLPECTIYEYLLENNKGNLDNIAIDYFGRNISFRTLFENIEKVAKAFTAAGIKEGDNVIVSSVTLPEIIYSIYALNRLGAIPNMVDPRTSVEGIREYILEANSPLILTIDVAYPKMVGAAENTSVKTIVTLPASESMPFFLGTALKLRSAMEKKKYDNGLKWSSFISSGAHSIVLAAQYSPHNCCMIVHTGGTTGMPKGVMLSNDNANAAYHQAVHSPINMKRGDVFLNIMPPFIAYGVILGIHTAMCWGWKSIIIPKFDPQSFDKLLLKHKPNGLIGVPSYFETLMDSKRMQTADLSFIKCVLAGGDKTQVGFEERINTFLHDHHANIHLTKGYSLTEASAMAAVSFENTVRTGSSGIPLPKTVISTFEEGTDKELRCGELGELCMVSPTIMMGYYKNPEATDNILRTHTDGRKWIHTGDLGRVDHDGMIFIEGRLKRLIIRHDGFKVFPPFVEKVLLNHPAVADCCVVSQNDIHHGHGKLPFVFVVLKPGNQIPGSQIIEELNAICQNELPEYSQPAGFRIVPELPLTPIGKIDYLTLEKQVG